MNHITLFRLLICATSLTAVSKMPAQQSATPLPAARARFGAVVGMVRSAADVPCGGATVTISRMDGSGIRATLSASNGMYSFSDLPAGAWTDVRSRGLFQQRRRSYRSCGGKRHPIRHPDYFLAPGSGESNKSPSDHARAPPFRKHFNRLRRLRGSTTSLRSLSAISPGSTARRATKTPCSIRNSSRRKSDSTRTSWRTSTNRWITPSCGATESFRSGEVQVEQISVGGDFHWQNVRGRVLYHARTVCHHDAAQRRQRRGRPMGPPRRLQVCFGSYGGYHFNVNHGLNVDAGIFVSYIGLFSYYNFDNWTYQPSYVSSNTPWFFNGLRVQWFPTNKLKIEPWFINGWQSYAKFNGHPGLGGQILWKPKEWFKLVVNKYGNGQDNLGLPKTAAHPHRRQYRGQILQQAGETQASPRWRSPSRPMRDASMAAGTCNGGTGEPSKQSFLGWMLYNRMWFHKDMFAVTLGGGKMSNPGRYLTLLPPINGADAVSGSPYFTENPGEKAHMWDSTRHLPVHAQTVHHLVGGGRISSPDVPYSRAAAASRLRREITALHRNMFAAAVFHPARTI